MTESAQCVSRATFPHSGTGCPSPARDEPPPGYDLDSEVDGVRRVADAHGFGRFHLVGYSAGGAVSLAFTSLYGDPERHHFDPPHRVEPEHLADSLLTLWQRAEQ